MNIGKVDKNNIHIRLGDTIRTDEAGWIGKVFCIEGDFCVIGRDGFTSAPDWEKCEVIEED